jgi:hypothetical protein
MVEWHPRRILFGRWLVHYRDTDRLPDLSDTWCVIESRPHATSSFSMEVVQDGDVVTITVDEITASGTLGGPDGRTLELTVEVPDHGETTLVLTFDADGEGLSGHFDAGGDSATLSGSRGACFDYEFPPGDPVCTLPVPDTSLVLGGQQFNSVTADVVHTGLDFRLETPLAEIVAPCDGVVTEINRGEIGGGTLIVDVTIRYNDDWSTFIAFEPYSTDPAVVEQQEEEIAVAINQVVRRGDLLGRLVVPDPLTEYPHVHWGVDRRDPDRTPVCPRDALPPAEQAELDALYGSFGLLPACLPAP